jgi:nicotinamide mononucleotide transporter
MLAIELASALLNGVYAIGLAVRKRWAWSLGFLGSLLGSAVMLDAKLYAESVLQVVYSILAVLGWISWGNGFASGPPTRKFDVGIALILTLTVGGGMWAFSDNPRPIWDSVLFSGGLLATWWQVRGDRWNWPLWIGLNLAGLWLYADRGLWAYSAYSGFMAAVACWGWFRWNSAPHPIR